MSRISGLAFLTICSHFVSGAGNDSKVGVAGAGAGGNIAATLAHEVRGLSYQVTSAAAFTCNSTVHLFWLSFDFC